MIQAPQIARAFPLSVNQPFVAAEVTRRTQLIRKAFRLLTSAATVQGFKARKSFGRILTPALSHRERENRSPSHQSWRVLCCPEAGSNSPP
jgi:hypothetical protein